MNTAVQEKPVNKQFKVVNETEKQPLVDNKTIQKFIGSLSSLEYNPKTENKLEAYEGKLKFYGYEDVGFLIQSLLKTTVKSINFDNMQELIKNPEENFNDINNILNLVLQLLPINELEILSELREVSENRTLNNV